MCRQRAIYFMIFLFSLVLCSNFVFHFLTKFWLIVTILSFLIVSLLSFGIKKENSRYRSEIIAKIFAWISVSLIIQFVIGVNIGFLKNSTPKSEVFYVVFLIISSEFLRYVLCFKSKDNKQLILIVIMFSLVEIIFPVGTALLKDADDIVEFLTVYVFPVISKNVLLTYLSKKIGYSPCLIYRFIMELYVILIPILPNFEEYLSAMISIVFPLLLFYNIYKMLKKSKKEWHSLRGQRNMDKVYKGMFFALFLLLVYFTSGVFRFYALTIVTGSMKPTINEGDIIIVDKYYKKNAQEINLGDVLVFNKGGVAVSHRVVEIKKKDNEFNFYTKGDNNNALDNWIVKTDEIIGVTKTIIPFVGYPVFVWNKIINNNI